MRSRKTGIKKNDDDVELMGAQTWTDHWSSPPDRTTVNTLFSFFGNHQKNRPNNLDVFWNMCLEFLGCVVLAMVVTIARSLSTGGNAILNGFMVGLVYAGAYYGIHQLPNQVAVRRHLNWGVSLAYVVLGELGIFGWLLYAVVQTLGAITGGAIIGSLPILGAVATVPTPTTAITTISYAIGFEFLATFLIIMGLVSAEFWSTPTIYFKDPEEPTEQELAAKAIVLGNNYENGTRVAAILILVFVTVLFPIQNYTFSNVTYLGGLFAGFDQTGIRDIAAAASLSTLANTVFVNGSAWALYTWMSGLAGLAAGLLYLLFLAGRTFLPRGMTVRFEDRKSPLPDSTSAPANLEGQYLAHVSSAAVQERALTSPYHRMK